MQSLKSGVRSKINSIHYELNGIATPGTESTPLTETQTNREESRKEVAMQNISHNGVTGPLRWPWVKQ